MSTVQGHHQQRNDLWLKAGLMLVLLLLLLADSYAIYQVYIHRMGNALDYYPFWAGGRKVVLEQQNPYDQSVMLEIQTAIYGRPALPEENQHGYAYPAYAPFVTLPFVVLPFSLSASLWIAIQQALVVASVILTVQATGWRIGRWQMILLCLAAMTFRYSMITFVLGQTSIWVLASLALALWAASRRRGALAGLALAAGTIKPQLVILPILAILVSARPKQRKPLVLALGAATIVLLGLSWIFAGSWIGDYWQLLQAYQGYSTTEFPIISFTQAWLPQPFPHLLNAATIVLLLGLLAFVAWRHRGTGQLTLSVALAVTVTQFVVPQTGSYNLVLLLLPVTVALYYLNKGRLRKHWAGIAGRVFVWADIVIVPWLLWPTLQSETWRSLDVVIVPSLIYLVLGLIICAKYGGKAEHARPTTEA